ncbi:hypothetical protein ABEF93_008648 [Exophiala dermatitidis]
MSQTNLNIRYNALLQAVAELDRMTKPEKTVAVQGIFKEENGTDSKEIVKTYTADGLQTDTVAKSMIETQKISNSILKAAKCFQYDAPDHIAQI